eukprot:scaffold1247_cov251-Pinguiococcus_pyrenoidosus.AAC.35
MASRALPAPGASEIASSASSRTSRNTRAWSSAYAKKGFFATAADASSRTAAGPPLSFVMYVVMNDTKNCPYAKMLSLATPPRPLPHRKLAFGPPFASLTSSKSRIFSASRSPPFPASPLTSFALSASKPRFTAAAAAAPSSSTPPSAASSVSSTARGP